MLLWMDDLAANHDLHGTDIDAEAIAWCQEHIPHARVGVNDADPPLPYADGAFDLVFNHSVFTHIDERRQDQWLTELRRVTRPGGFLVLSTHGEAALPEGDRSISERLERDGIVFLDGHLPADFPLPNWYQITFHAPWYVFEHWARWFDVRGYIPAASLGLQDHVLLERRPDSAPTPSPLAARPRRPAKVTPASRVMEALAASREYRSGAPGSPPRASPVRSLARNLVLRAIRPYTVHEDKFDDAVAASIADLTNATDHHASVLRDLQRGAGEDR
jgi:SAM-dependent methyltransferase